MLYDITYRDSQTNIYGVMTWNVPTTGLLKRALYEWMVNGMGRYEDVHATRVPDNKLVRH